MGHEIVVKRSDFSVVYVWIYPIVALGRGGNFLASGARVAVRAHWSTTFAEKNHFPPPPAFILIGIIMAIAINCAAPLIIIGNRLFASKINRHYLQKIGRKY